MVHLKRGLVPIENVKIGDEVLTQDGYNKITDWFDQGEREIVRINTEDGYFECTENHRMPVLKGFGKIEWVTADKLQKNDILMTTRTPIEGVKTQLPQDYDFKFTIYIPMRFLREHDINIPELDADMAWFIGIFLANGYVGGYVGGRPIKVCLDLSELNIATKVVNQFSRFGNGLTITLKQYSRDKMYTVVCNSVRLVEYFHQHIKQPQTDMEIPQWILESTVDIRKAFIAGVLDGNGSASENIVTTSIYGKFITGIQHVLYSCGIESRLTEVFDSKTIYCLRLITKHSVDEINKAPQLCKKLVIVTDTSIDEFELLVGKVNFCPVKVKSVVPSNKDYTYDITVENQHNFYCNGYNSHNTAEMFIFEPDDYEVLFAKYGINGFYQPSELEHHIDLGNQLEQFGIKPKWFDHLTDMFKEKGFAVREGLHYRHLSNNSILFPERPTLEYLKLLIKILRYEGEPGLLNLAEMQRRRPNAELVNPCVTADTMVETDHGPVQVKDLIGKQFNSITDSQVYPSTADGFFKTGHKQVYRLMTKDGHFIRLTADHRVVVVRYGTLQFIQANKIQPNDMIALNNIHKTPDKLTSQFESLVRDGTEDVYDCTIPEIHVFSANGIIVHNCGEIVLDTYQTCNLTTVNLMQFVSTDDQGQPIIDKHTLLEAQRLSARAGLRMTLVTLELPHWDAKQKRDRLIGTSLTGIKDAMDFLNYTKEQEHQLVHELGEAARQEAVRYAKEIRVTAPLLVTTIKPEGSLSQVAGGVSQGLHLSHSPYYIRRIRINSRDPMVSVIQKANWRLNPEVGTPGATYEEKMANARTYVVDFPVFSSAKKTKYQTSIEEQLETYFTYQEIYADHNCSNTVSVKDDEWVHLPQIVYDNWDKYLGITFIPLDGGHYELAPYEECNVSDYQQLKDRMGPFDSQLLNQYDRQVYVDVEATETETEDSITMIADETMKSECSGGICPIR